MTRQRAIRKQIKARRAAVKARRAELRKQAAQTPAARQARARRRRRTLLLILLLLLLLTRCMADEPLPTIRVGFGVPSTPASAVSQAPVSQARPSKASAKSKRLKRLKKKPRERWQPPPPRPAPWLGAFRMQVSARAPRLAPCFEGQPEPGALRWQATVDPGTGVVSDQRFDTRLDTPTARCLRAALAEPPYRLEGGTGPVPITLLIEF